MFLVPVSCVRCAQRTWIQVSGDQFLVPETWAENFGRVPSTLCVSTVMSVRSYYAQAQPSFIYLFIYLLT